MTGLFDRPAGPSEFTMSTATPTAKRDHAPRKPRPGAEETCRVIITRYAALQSKLDAVDPQSVAADQLHRESYELRRRWQIVREHIRRYHAN